MDAQGQARSLTPLHIAGREQPHGWLERFHAGKHDVIKQCYLEQYQMVSVAVGQVLGEADQETVVHELFFRLLSRESMRRSFRGGSLESWLFRVARNLALDFARKHRRELPMDPSDPTEGSLQRVDAGQDHRLEASILVDQFRQQVLPQEWAGVFELRFIKRLTQREAAARLGLGRTTLAYRELRIKRMLRAFLLDEGEGS